VRRHQNENLRAQLAIAEADRTLQGRRYNEMLQALLALNETARAYGANSGKLIPAPFQPKGGKS